MKRRGKCKGVIVHGRRGDKGRLFRLRLQPVGRRGNGVFGRRIGSSSLVDFYKRASYCVVARKRLS